MPAAAPPAASSVVEVRQLRKNYGPLTALDGIDFQLSQGEIFALLGPNGAGKSTCIEILEGFRRPSGGQVRVLGHDPQQHLLSIKERVGFVSQESGVELVHTPREMLSTYRLCYANARQTDELLELVGLSDKADAKISQLSGGQRRRLDLALGLVGNPELLFLDEPTTGFSPEARRECWRTLLDLKQSGMTILLTSHYMDEVSFLADRMAVLIKGQIAFLGEPGGLGQDNTVVEFVLPPGWELDDLLGWLAGLSLKVDLVGSASQKVAQKVALSVGDAADPTELLYHLTQRARAEGVSLAGLSVTNPTLEDNYLRLLEAHDSLEPDA